MKHTIVKFFTVLLTLTLLATCVCATPSRSCVVVCNRIELPNGDYIIETITENEMQTYATNTKSGTKTATRYTSSNVPLFSVTVTGTFTYTGTTSKATSATSTVNILNSNVSYISKSSSCSGKSATATGAAAYNNITYSATTTLTCSATGTLS